MLFYFVRHGQTEANRQHLLAGAGLDLPLNEVGHQQAQALALTLRRALPRPVERIIASTMVRARQTATYLADELALPLTLHADWREWHLGEWEGKTFAEFGHLILGDGEPKQGEARKLFYSRVDQAWRQFHTPDQPYLVVSHGAVWLALQDLLKIPRFKLDNCDLVEVAAQGERWQARVLRTR